MNNNENNNNFSSQVPKRGTNNNGNIPTPDPEFQTPNPPSNDQEDDFSTVPEPKESRPFYKKWWFWLIIILLIAAISFGVFWMLNQKPDAKDTDGAKETRSSVSSIKKGANNASKKNKKQSLKPNSNQKSQSLPGSQPASGNKATTNAAIGKTGSALEVFNAIKLGDTTQDGIGGNSESELKKLLGDPQKTEELTYQGKNAKKETWGSVIGITQGSGTMVIMIQKGAEYFAVSKTSVGISSDQKESHFNLDQYNKLEVQNLTPEKIVQEFGQPNAMTTSLIDGKNYTSYTWNANLKGSPNAYMTVNFTDNIAVSKDQQGLQ